LFGNILQKSFEIITLAEIRAYIEQSVLLIDMNSNL